MSDDALAGLRALLLDGFSRVEQLATGLADGLTDAVGAWRPDPDANSIDWLLWHSARVQDAQVADLAGTEQVWHSGGWVDRFALPLPPDATGYGQTSQQVGQVRADADLLRDYAIAANAATTAYLQTLTVAELARVVDTRWDPPVTAAVRLVSILGDCLEHLGQAGYVRGLATRAGIR